ncbi:MAG: DUF5618 family protein [bacterium]
MEYDRYKDRKYVKEASAMAYLAALSAIDGYLLSIGTPQDKLPKSIDEYGTAMHKILHNGKFLYFATFIQNYLLNRIYYIKNTSQKDSLFFPL